jgi:WD40 repeat protein
VAFLSSPPSVPISAVDSFELVTANQNGLKFWSLKGRNLTATRGEIIDATGIIAATTALAGLSDPQKTASGDAEGNLWVWHGASRGARLGSHSGPVTCLTAFKVQKVGRSGPSGLISGSTDSIKIWNLLEMSAMQEISIASLISQVGRSSFYKSCDSTDASLCGKNAPGFVTAVSTDAAQQRLLVALSSSLVVEVPTNAGAACIISEGCGAEITAMCALAGTANTIVTASADCMIRCWNVSSGETTLLAKPGVLSAFPIPNKATALQSIRDNCFAIATNETADTKSPGMVLIVQVTMTFEMTVVQRLSSVGRGKITFIRVSRVNEHAGAQAGAQAGSSPKRAVTCAIGSDDGSVYVYECRAPSSFIPLGSFIVDKSRTVPCGLDFSIGGRYMRVYSGPLRKVKYFAFAEEDEQAAGTAAAVAAAKEVSSPEWVVANIAFASISYPTAREAKAVLNMSASRIGGREPVSVSTWPIAPAADVSMMAVTYADGHLGLLKGPYVAPEAQMAEGAALQSGPTFGVFVQPSNPRCGDRATCIGDKSVRDAAVFCTYGGADGSILMWDTAV